MNLSEATNSEGGFTPQPLPKLHTSSGVHRQRTQLDEVLRAVRLFGDRTSELALVWCGIPVPEAGMLVWRKAD